MMYNVMMTVDEVEYKYGCYNDRNKANKVANDLNAVNNDIDYYVVET